MAVLPMGSSTLLRLRILLTKMRYKIYTHYTASSIDKSMLRVVIAKNEEYCASFDEKKVDRPNIVKHIFECIRRKTENCSFIHTKTIGVVLFCIESSYVKSNHSISKHVS